MSVRHHRVLVAHGYSPGDHGSGYYRYEHKDGVHEASHDTFERKTTIMKKGTEETVAQAGNHTELHSHLSKLHGAKG